jgi:hypothetical protein
MEYIDVLWRFQSSEYPYRLVSELGDDRFELRKLEFFADGTVDAAGGDRETERTILGVVAVPPLSVINKDEQFEGTIITRDAFEALWLKYAR